MPRTFDSFDFRRELVISASQIQTFIACPRQWMKAKRWKLPQEDKGYTIFGDVAHGVAERWLLADDTGRDPATGQQVELYPDDWDVVDGRSGIVQITRAQALLAKTLIGKAIDAGVLRRMPGREIEASFQVEVIPGVDVIGFLDVALPRGVEDHKTSSSTKWLKTQDDLREDVQMLLYAAVIAQRWVKAGNDISELNHVTLRHNQMVKSIDNPVVKATETSVPLARVERFWKELVIPCATRMLEMKRANVQEDDWSKIQGPRTKNTCRAYGGCSYARICGGMESPLAYRKRMARLKSKTKTSTTQRSDPIMSIFDRLDAAEAIATPEAARQGDEPKPEPETKTKPETKAPQKTGPNGGASLEQGTPLPSDDPSTPPWARAKCKACRNSPVRGFNSKAAVCRACDVMQAKDGLTTSEGYEIALTEDGRITWSKDVVTGEAQFTGEAKATEDVEPRPKHKNVPEAAPPAATDGETVKTNELEFGDPPETGPIVPPAKGKKTTTDTTDAKNKGGRPRKGFVLLVNATVARGKSNVVDLNQVFHVYAAQLAEAQGADSYYALDSFKRKDWMAMKAEEIAKTFGPAFVVVSVTNDDVRKFTACIAPFAADIITGTTYA